MIYENLCILVLGKKIASTLEGLIGILNCFTLKVCISVCGSSVVLLDVFLYETGVHNNIMNDNGICL